MTTTENILLPEEIKDTTQLQVHSLLGYMQALGYTFNMNAAGNSWFVSKDYINKGRGNIAFSTAVDIYNGRYHDNHGYLRTEYPFDFNVYRLRKAESARLVNFCNLQMSKKTGFIKATSNLVNFTKSEYYDMFITSKHFPF